MNGRRIDRTTYLPLEPFWQILLEESYTRLDENWDAYDGKILVKGPEETKLVTYVYDKEDLWAKDLREIAGSRAFFASKVLPARIGRSVSVEMSE